MWQTKIFNGLDINAKIFDEFTIIVDISRNVNSQRKNQVFNIRNIVTYEREIVKTEYQCRLTSYKAPYIACLTEKQEENGKTLQVLETFRVENGTVNPLCHLTRCLPFLPEKAEIILCHYDGVYIATTKEIYFIPHGDPNTNVSLNTSEVLLYSSNEVILKKYDPTICCAEENNLILANSMEATIWNRSCIDGSIKLTCIAKTKTENGETIRKICMSPDSNHTIIVSSKTIYYCSSRFSQFIDLFDRETNIFDLDYSILNISKCVDNLCVYLDHEMLILGNVIDSIYVCDLVNDRRKSSRFSLRHGFLRYSNPKCKIYLGRVVQNYFYVINEQGYFSLFEISPNSQQFKAECPGFIGYRMDSYLTIDKSYLHLLLNVNNKIVLKKWKTEEIKFIGRGHEFLRDDTYPESKLIYSDVLYISDKYNNVKKKYFEVWPNLLIEHEPDQTRISSKCYDMDESTKIEYIDKTNSISLTLPSKKTFEFWCEHPYLTREFYDSLISQKENSEVISKWFIDYELFTDFASSDSRRIKYAKYNGMQVALKFYERKDAFSSEFNSLRKLKHPSIMSLIGVSEFGENHIIVQSRLSTNLQKVIKDLRRDKKHFKQCIVLKISLDIIKGLEYFHSFLINNERDQIFHNDIKLDNILVVNEDLLKANCYEGQLVKISDFECSTRDSLKSASPFVERNRIKDNEYNPDDIKSFGNILQCIILRVVNTKDCNKDNIPRTWNNLLEYVAKYNVQAEDIKMKLLDIALDAISDRSFKIDINKLDEEEVGKNKIYMKNETKEWFKSTISNEGLLNNRLIIIEGERGFGKTTFLKCIKKFGKIQGFRCLSGEWERDKLSQPFSAILNSIRNYISHYLIPTVLYDYIDTEVNDYFIRKEEVINLSPSKIWKSIFAIFRQLCTEPTILILDDLQNIDSVSLNYLPTLLNIPNLMVICGSTKPITEYSNLKSYKSETFYLKRYTDDEIMKIFMKHKISANLNILNALTDSGHPSRVHSLLMGILMNKIDITSIYKPNKDLYDIMWENLSDYTKDILYIVSCIKVLDCDRYLIQEIYDQMKEKKVQLYTKKKPKEVYSNWYIEAQMYGFLKNENDFIDEKTRKYVYNKIVNKKDIHYFIYNYLSRYIKKGIEFYHEILLQACECNFPTFEGYPIKFQPSFFLNVALSVNNEDELKNIIEKAFILTTNKKINFDEDTLAIAQRCYDYGFYAYASILTQSIKEKCQHSHLLELKCLSKTNDYDNLLKLILQIKESNIYTNDIFIFLLTKVLFTIDPESSTSNNESVKKIVSILFESAIDKSILSPHIIIWCAMLVDKQNSDELFEYAFHKLLEDSFNCYDHANIREISLSLIYLSEYYLYRKQEIQSIFLVLNKAKDITEQNSLDDLTDRCYLDITMAYIIFSYSTNIARTKIKESIERYLVFGSRYTSQNKSILHSILTLSGQTNVDEELNVEPTGVASIALKCYSSIIFEKYLEAMDLLTLHRNLILQSSNGNINYVQSFYIFILGLTSSLVLMRNEDTFRNINELKNDLDYSVTKLQKLAYNKNIVYYFFNIISSNREVIRSNYNENTIQKYNQVITGTYSNLVALTYKIYSDFLPFHLSTSTYTRNEMNIQSSRLFKRIGIIKQHNQKELTQMNNDYTEESNMFWPMDFLLKNSSESQGSSNKLVTKVTLNSMKFLNRKTTAAPKQPEVLNINNLKKLTPKIFGNKHFCKLDVKSSYVELYDVDLFRNLIVFSIATIHEESNVTMLYVQNEKDVSEHTIFKFYVSNHPRDDFSNIKYSNVLPKRFQQKLSKFYQLDIEFGYYENENEKILTYMFPFHKHKSKSHKIGYIGKNTFNQCSLKSKLGNLRLSAWENIECISHSADISYLFVDIEPQEKNDQTITKLKSYKDIHTNVKLVAVGKHLQDDIFDVVLKSSSKLEEYMEEARRGVTCNLF